MDFFSLGGALRKEAHSRLVEFCIKFCVKHDTRAVSKCPVQQTTKLQIFSNTFQKSTRAIGQNRVLNNKKLYRS